MVLIPLFAQCTGISIVDFEQLDAIWYQIMFKVRGKKDQVSFSEEEISENHQGTKFFWGGNDLPNFDGFFNQS